MFWGMIKADLDPDSERGELIFGMVIFITIIVMVISALIAVWSK